MAGRPSSRVLVYVRVDEAREHQDEKFGWMGSDNPMSHLPQDDSHNDAKLKVCIEELGEVARELNDSDHRPLDRAKLHKELAQLAACCVAWIEADYERGWRP